MTADEFNAAHPIGTPVIAFPGTRDGRALRTRTRTPAWRLGGHTDVVAVEGYAGGIALTHIETIEETPATEQQSDQQERELDAWMTRAYEAEGKLWKAEARIKAVEDVLAHQPYGGPDQEDAIRRALKSVPPPRV